MSWLSENVFDPIEHVGSALFHGDITGGQHQASGSDWLKTGLTAAALGGGAALGAGALGTFGAAEGAAAGGSALASTAPELTGAFGEVAATSDPFAAFAAATPAETAETAGAGGLPQAAGGAQAPSWLSAEGVSPVGTGGFGEAGGTAAKAAPSFWDSMTSGAMNSITKNPLGIGLAGAGLGYSVLRGNPNSANYNNLNNLGSSQMLAYANDTATGRQLQSYLQNGNLPPGMQAKVDQARAQAIADATGMAAKAGQSTSPTSNSTLAAAIEKANQDALIAVTNMETQLFAAGSAMLTQATRDAQLSADTYKVLMGADRQNNQDVTQAIALMAAAFGGGTRGVNVNLGGTRAA